MPRRSGKDTLMDTVSARVPKEVRSWLKKSAKSSKKTLSQYVQELLLAHYQTNLQEVAA